MKRFLRWLLREDLAREIEAEKTTAYAAGVQFAQGMYLEKLNDAKQLAYAQGQLVGRREMYDAIEESVVARRGDNPEAADLQAGRKLLH